MRKNNLRLGEKFLYLILIIFGIILILFATTIARFVSCASKNITPNGIEHISDVLSDIGVGLFPTGAVSLIVSIMQTKSDIKTDKFYRHSVLNRLCFYLDDFLYTFCKSYTLNRSDNINSVEQKLALIKKETQSSMPTKLSNKKATIDELLKNKSVSIILSIDSIEFNEYINIFNEQEKESITMLKKAIEQYSMSNNERDLSENIVTLITAFEMIFPISEFKHIAKCI